jgi:hypothetical protein
MGGIAPSGEAIMNWAGAIELGGIAPLGEAIGMEYP